MASLAAFQPRPYMAVYWATKAFVLSFSEARWAEYHPRGVRVLALCPGVTETPFFQPQLLIEGRDHDARLATWSRWQVVLAYRDRLWTILVLPGPGSP